MTIHRGRPTACSVRLDAVDVALDRYFPEIFGRFLTLRGAHKDGASLLQAGCKVGL